MNNVGEKDKGHKVRDVKEVKQLIKDDLLEYPIELVVCDGLLTMKLTDYDAVKRHGNVFFEYCKQNNYVANVRQR